MAASLPPGTDPFQVPAGQAPPGYQSNLVDPPNRGVIFLIFGPILTFFMLVFLGIRVYTKAFIIRQATPDDFMCLIASLGAIIYFIILCIFLSNGTYGRHIWDVSVGALSTKEFGILSYLVNWLPNPIWLSTKLTLFIFFLQIFKPKQALRWMIWLGIIVSTLFYLSITIPQIYWATPKHGVTWYENIADGETAKTEALSTPLAAFNLAIDIYIFVLPLWGISSLKISRKKKIGVVLIFATGFTAIVTSLIALIYKIRIIQEPADFTYTSFPALITNYTEMAVGIIVSCMPSCSTTLRHHSEWFEQLGSRLSYLTHRRRGGSGDSETNNPRSDAASIRSAPQEASPKNLSRSDRRWGAAVASVELSTLPKPDTVTQSVSESEYPEAHDHAQ